MFCASMDMSKEFDVVKWQSLFETLMARKIRAIFLRILLHIYEFQICKVKWGEELSCEFGVKNGVRQGGVTSAIFFAVYIDDLLKILRQSGFGCNINGVFYGAIIYADDILLLSGSRNGLQNLVNLSSRFAM